MKILLVPRVCKDLVDQSLCQQAVNACGANTDPDFCAVKLVGKALSDPEPLAVAKSLVGFGKDTYHFVMSNGHNYLHEVADRTVWWWVNDCCKAAVGG